MKATLQEKVYDEASEEKSINKHNKKPEFEKQRKRLGKGSFIEEDY